MESRKQLRGKVSIEIYINRLQTLPPTSSRATGLLLQFVVYPHRHWQDASGTLFRARMARLYGECNEFWADDVLRHHGAKKSVGVGVVNRHGQRLADLPQI